MLQGLGMGIQGTPVKNSTGRKNGTLNQNPFAVMLVNTVSEVLWAHIELHRGHASL